MITRKRVAPTVHEGSSNLRKVRRQTEQFESQDIWRNLERVRTNIAHADATKKNSRLFIPIYTGAAIKNAKLCVETLHEYIESSKIQLREGESSHGPIAYVSLKNFNLLDCCLVLAVILSSRDRDRSVVKTKKDIFTIPRNVTISGTFYLPSNFTQSSTKTPATSTLNICESGFANFPHFKEFYVNLAHGNSLSHFISGVSSLFMDSKFGKCNKSSDKEFGASFFESFRSIGLSIHQNFLPHELLFDMKILSNVNKTQVEQSKENLIKYAESLITSNNSDGAEKSVGETSGAGKATAPHSKQTNLNTFSVRPSASKDNTSRYTAPSNGNNAVVANTFERRTLEASAPIQNGGSTFMSQEQIKEHCQATVLASIDAVKQKSPYQIFTMYVKCPRQKYIDLIYQDMNDLRSQSNCNIVILNLNNLNESIPWFESLDIGKFTAFSRAPHPSTVRVISIGGIGEHMIKALELISRIMES